MAFGLLNIHRPSNKYVSNIQGVSEILRHNLKVSSLHRNKEKSSHTLKYIRKLVVYEFNLTIRVNNTYTVYVACNLKLVH